MKTIIHPIRFNFNNAPENGIHEKLQDSEYQAG